MKIGKPVFKRDGATATPDYISSDCPMAGHHIEQGMCERNALRAGRSWRIRSRLCASPTASD